ncbi:MAG TPA: transglutaminase domain-containing protein [Planctomycetota bacterium]|nr:transglutaminase domain-containing protein [Planctomycetota bacterium]
MHLVRFLVWSAGVVTATVLAQSPANALGDALAAALARAGEHRVELERALHDVPPAQRPGLEFLLANMPDGDLRTLGAVFLLRQTALAYAARAAAPWGKELTDELFLQWVLPYAAANEQREDWRSDFVRRFAPLVADCKTPGEAALRLNSKVFAALHVHYSTDRKRADQCPSESIAQGKASCTGLAILLADACRTVAVPARVVSVRWPHKPGNHTWVEVWDGSAWRFVGADEPDPQGFVRAWFTGDAAQCSKADDAHHIWAVSFAATGQRFLAGWAKGIELHGIDVSARYAPAAAAAQDPAVAADAAVRAQLDRFFAADAAAQANFEFDRNLDTELRTAAGDARLRALAFAAFRAAAHTELRAEFAANQVRAGGRQSPFTVKTVGERPANGFALVIAMHGGGGVKSAVNDQQWQVMQRYYKDHPEAGGYRYCALRAPTDEWNGFYTDYVYPLVERLIRQFTVAGDIDPDKVFLIGYSHGGYGAFAIGPKLADRFAAVHASAGAPTDGETSGVNLRHLQFSFMVGEQDNAYGRRERCEKFDAAIQALRGERTDIYPVTFEFAAGHQHTGLPDRDKLATLLAAVRTPLPRDLAWELTDAVVRDFHWLAVEQPGKGQRIDAAITGQRLTVQRSGGAAALAVRLDARLVDLAQPLTVAADGAERQVTPAPSLRTLCSALLQRADPQLAWSWELALPAPGR